MQQSKREFEIACDETYVDDPVRALFDGGWRAEDGEEALEAAYGMTAAEAAKTVQGLEALEADLEARALMDAIEEQDDEIPEGPTSCSAARGRSSRIIHEKNRKAIERMISEAEGRATARCLTYRDLVSRIDQLERALGIAKKDMEGIKYDLDDNAQDFPNSYKYAADSTHAVVERTGGKWRLTKVYRGRCRTANHVFICLEMPDATKAAIVASVRDF